MGGALSKRRGRPSAETPRRGSAQQHGRAPPASSPAAASAPAGGVVASPLQLQPQVRDAAIAAAAAAAAPAAAPALPVALVVLAHHHSVYCDRKRVVCTAEGAVREGNRLGVVVPALGIAAPTGAHARYAPQPAGTRVTWYSSSGGGVAAAERADEAHPATLTAGERTLWPVPRRTLAEVLPRAARAAPALAHLADDDAAAATAAATYAEAVSTAAHAPSESPLFTSAGAMRLLQAEACLSTSDELQYHLTAADAGHLIGAVVSTAAAPAPLASAVVGPVESAPPRIRELWIEGEPVVGGRLVARAVYWGGEPGPCLWSWILVDAEGGRTETAARAAHPTAELLHTAAGAGEDDPRVRWLTGGDLVGCSLKVTCEPVRADGARGAPTTSRPTGDVAAAPAAAQSPGAAPAAEAVGPLLAPAAPPPTAAATQPEAAEATVGVAAAAPEAAAAAPL